MQRPGSGRSGCLPSRNHQHRMKFETIRYKLKSHHKSRFEGGRMDHRRIRTAACFAVAALFASSAAFAQMGRTWPSEKKIVPDPVTGLPLTFLTSTDVYHQSKIYQTHRQWTSDGKWLIFRGARETGSQAFAVNEETGLIVQVTETGFSGMLCASNIAMKLYVLTPGGGGRGAGRGPSGPRQILEID